MSDRYRPSSGTEGLDFFHRWCHRCAKDDGTEELRCPIIADTMVYEVDDPRYPKEWVYQAPNGVPRCTAFKAAKP